MAISSAKAAYQIYKDIFDTNRFKKLADKGACAQRLLWANTSTKNSDLSDIKYIEQIIGPETVNTVPLETLNAYRDHGDPQLRLEQDTAGAGTIMDQLSELGINIDTLTQQLEDEGVLSILHLNGYKIANPTVFARIQHEELEKFLQGCG